MSNKLMLNIPENTGVNNPFSSKHRNLMFLVSNNREYLIGLIIHLIHIILELVDLSFKGVNILKIGITFDCSLKSFIIIHSKANGFDDHLELHLSQSISTFLYF